MGCVAQIKVLLMAHFPELFLLLVFLILYTCEMYIMRSSVLFYVDFCLIYVLNMLVVLQLWQSFAHNRFT